MHHRHSGFCEQADAIFRLDDANFVLKNGGLENFVTISRPPKQQAQEGVRKMKANCLSVCGPHYALVCKVVFPKISNATLKLNKQNFALAQSATCLPQNKTRASLKTKTPPRPIRENVTVGTELPLLASAVENCCRNQHWNATSPAKSTEGGNWQRSTMPRFRRTWLHMARGYVQVQRVSERPRALSSEMHPVHEAGSQS